MGLAAMGVSMMDTGQIYLMEQALCRDYYSELSPQSILSNSSIPEAQCKLEPIQAKLAALMGCFSISSLIPGE
jgi:hypothetical protein